MNIINKAAFLDLASVHRDDLDLSRLISVADEWLWLDNITESELANVLCDVDVVVSNKIVLGADQLQQANHLKLICVAATGTNNIDLEAAKLTGINVCNVQAYATASVVQHVFSLLLSLTTHQREYTSDVQKGLWSKSEFFCLLDHPIRELQGKTLGIIGYGELGKAVAKVAEAFGMRVLLAKRDEQDQREGRLSLNELLPQIDVLSLHCPLTEDNLGLIGEHELALMKADAVLINTARGGLVDETALLDALQHKRLGAAALDVLEQEPPASSHALIDANLKNLIITPHVAWASVESRQRLIDEVAKNISAFAEGVPRNVVS